MTKNEFIKLCSDNLIDTELALENEKIIQALQAKNDKLVKKLLITEF